jgi:hypothetical protein
VLQLTTAIRDKQWPDTHERERTKGVLIPAGM